MDAKPRRIAAALVLGMALVGTLIAAAAGPVAAAQRGPTVSVDPTPGFARTDRITVTVDGASDFAGGSVVVYLCGNADGGGNPIEVEAADCIDPGTRGYVTEAVDGDSVSVRYRLRYDGIGVNDRQCLPQLAGEAACQLVVALVRGSDVEMFGIAVDDFIARVPTTGDWDATPDSLPVTGLSARATGLLAGGAAIALYLGLQFRRAAVPATVRQD